MQPSSTTSSPRSSDLEALVAALPEGNCEEDSGLACDPCIWDDMSIDDRTETSYCCGTQLTAGFDAAYDALLNKVDEIACYALQG